MTDDCFEIKSTSDRKGRMMLAQVEVFTDPGLPALPIAVNDFAGRTNIIIYGLFEHPDPPKPYYQSLITEPDNKHPEEPTKYSSKTFVHDLYNKARKP